MCNVALIFWPRGHPSAAILFSNHCSASPLHFLLLLSSLACPPAGGNRRIWTKFDTPSFSRDPSGSSWRPPIELVDRAASGRCEAVSPFHKHFMARGGFQEIGSRSRALSSTADFRPFKHVHLIFSIPKSTRLSVAYSLLPQGHDVRKTI